MRKIRAFLLPWFAAILWVSPSSAQQQPTVLIAYYSHDGHTRAMAEAVAQGARSVKNLMVKLLEVDRVQKEDLLTADALIVGSPVHNANVAPEVARFISSWPFEGAPMRDKIGAAFVTAGGISAGEELTQMNILHSMLIYGMIVVGGNDWTSAFGASAITVEKPFDQGQGERKVADQFLKKGKALGKRVAELTVKWKRGH